MTITRKYIRQCRTLFPVYGNSERTFLNRLKVQINEHLDLFPDLSYEELVKQFGTAQTGAAPCVPACTGKGREGRPGGAAARPLRGAGADAEQ